MVSAGVLALGSVNVGNPGFGKLGSSSATGRQIQFGLKLNF